MSVPRPLDLSTLVERDRVAAKEYDECLAELTFNSKIVINRLTVVAGENRDNAAVPIIYVITSRLAEAIGDQKLPLFYLLDSIVKNIGGVYVGLLRPKLPKLFLDAYPLCTPRTQGSMQRLLGTWNPVFGAEMVAHISQKLVEMTASMARFTDGGGPQEQQVHSSGGLRRSVLNPAPPAPSTTNAKIASQHQMESLFATVTAQYGTGRRPSKDQTDALYALINVQIQMSASQQEREQLESLRVHLKTLEGGPGAMSKAELCPGFDKIRSAPHAPVVFALYDGLEFLSKADGMRFGTVEAYRAHLDRLFKRNNRKRARLSGGHSRCWYKSEKDWRLSQLNPNVQETQENQDNWELKIQETAHSPRRTLQSSSAIVVNDDGDSCPVCGEGFQTFWDDDVGAWMNKDAVREAEDGPVFHPQCFNLGSPGTPRRSAASIGEKRKSPDTDDAQPTEKPVGLGPGLP